ncbi:hypothetical protein ACX800_22870 [Paenarthrobacter nitroguajacolicus]|uniref:hypothetical protein n=1 Tax=Micrococcaceae TaxID=1268 RepID=UPI001E351B14|nr:hypothetical protein [Arthrobacter sp. AK01]MCD4850767.1 hypothetical protein [Arthrobacter sp. AK01]
MFQNREGRSHPYTGPAGTNDFDNLTAEEMSELVSSYKLLGEAFEDRDDEAMFGLGFHMEDPLALIRYKADQADQARRELIAAIKLARYKGQDWTEIGPILGMTWVEAMKTFHAAGK